MDVRIQRVTVVALVEMIGRKQIEEWIPTPISEPLPSAEELEEMALRSAEFSRTIGSGVTSIQILIQHGPANSVGVKRLTIPPIGSGAALHGAMTELIRIATFS